MHTMAKDTSEIFLTLFVACYNEEQNIAGTLAACLDALKRFSFTWEIIVIDDASTDNSVQVIEAFKRSHPGLPIRLYVNPRNKGLAENYIDAAFLGKGTWYRLVCGDNVVPADSIAEVLEHIGEADMIIPYMAESKARTFFRRFLSTAYTSVVNLISGHRLHYYNGLAVHSRYNVMRWHGNSRGFGFQAELIVRLLMKGMTYREVQIVAHERAAGKSSALQLRNILSVAHTLLTLCLWRASEWLHGRPEISPQVVEQVAAAAEDAPRQKRTAIL